MYYLVKHVLKKGEVAKNLNPISIFLRVFRDVCFWDSVLLAVLGNGTEIA